MEWVVYLLGVHQKKRRVRKKNIIHRKTAMTYGLVASLAWPSTDLTAEAPLGVLPVKVMGEGGGE